MNITYTKTTSSYLINYDGMLFIVQGKDAIAMHPNHASYTKEALNAFLVEFAKKALENLKALEKLCNDLDYFTDLKDLLPDWYNLSDMEAADKQALRTQALELHFLYAKICTYNIKADLQALHIDFKLGEEHPITQTWQYGG